MRTRGSRVSRCPYWFHDVKQRSLLRSRGALLRSGLSAFVAFAFASLPPPAAAARAAAAGRHSPLRLQDRCRRRTSMSEVANPYTINSLRSQYRTHVVCEPYRRKRMPVTNRASFLPTATETHGPLSGGHLACVPRQPAWSDYQVWHRSLPASLPRSACGPACRGRCASPRPWS